jgi:hypothetical protein
MGLVEGGPLLASRLLYAVEFDNYFVEWPGMFSVRPPPSQLLKCR